MSPSVMQEASEIVDDLAAAGVAIEAVEGKIRLTPAVRVDRGLEGRVRASKTAILELLATRSPLPDGAEAWRAAVETIARGCRLPDDVLAELKAAGIRWR